MTLKKDAMIAVSMAGIVLIMGLVSTRVGREKPKPTLSEAVHSSHNTELLRAYIGCTALESAVSQEEAERLLANARNLARRLHKDGKLKAPIDFFRAGAILKTSTSAADLALAHELSVEALARGVKPAMRVIMETQDRLLLSSGLEQRYGTQREWAGRSLGEATTSVQPDEPGMKPMRGIGAPVQTRTEN
jgi:hypothetical protein